MNMLIIFVKEKMERYRQMVKIDTKEKFSIFRLDTAPITEKMADELRIRLEQQKEVSPGNAIVLLPENTPVPKTLISTLAALQSAYQTDRHSFVTAPVSADQRQQQAAWRDLETAPTLREAIDLVMMEELEREILGPEEGNAP